MQSHSWVESDCNPRFKLRFPTFAWSLYSQRAPVWVMCYEHCTYERLVVLPLCYLVEIYLDTRSCHIKRPNQYV